MAFYVVRKKKISGLYYPESVTVGKQVGTAQIATVLSDRSTVTKADAYAVLSDLGAVMALYMSQGRSVHLDGIGSFRYTINAAKNGVESEEEVSASQIRNIRVRFTPEVTRNSDMSVATRSMQPNAVDWMLWGGQPSAATSTEEDESGSGDSPSTNEPGSETSGGTDNSGGDDSNPL